MRVNQSASADLRRDSGVMRRHRFAGRAQRSEQGAAMVEFAFVIGLFVLLIFAAISFGYVFMLKQNMTHAAEEGARAATVVPLAKNPATQCAPGSTDPTCSQVEAANRQSSTSIQAFGKQWKDVCGAG